MAKSILILLAMVGTALAQQGTLGGPVAGFVFDRGAQALRPVRGIAGASTLGDPIDAGFQLKAAYVAPQQDSVFGIAADGVSHYFTLASGVTREVAIDGLIAQPGRLVYSPSGTSAALYSNGHAQLVTGLPAKPVVAGSIELRQGARDRGPAVTSLAISDDGAFLLFVVGNSIQLASQSGGVRSVMAAGSGASVAFAPGGHDAVMAARDTGAVFIRDVPGSAIQQPLAASDAPFQVVAGLAFSADGKHVFMASGAAKTVVAMDLTGNRTDIGCECLPSELSPMGSLFRLNELGSGPLWLADGASSVPRVVFVPALKAAQ